MSEPKLAAQVQQAVENYLRNHQDLPTLNKTIGELVAPGKSFEGRFVPYDCAMPIVEQTDDDGKSFSAVLTIQLDFTIGDGE